MKTTHVPSQHVLLHGGAKDASASGVARASGRETALRSAGVQLTARQLAVLALLAEGLPNKAICRRLGISTGTVKVHMSCIFRKLGVTSRLQAVVAAGREGLLDEPAAGGAAGCEPAQAERPSAAAAGVAGMRSLLEVS